MNHLSGQTIKGYELAERIGSGGFGAVYRAYQSTLGREVAIKIILPGYANQPEFIRRFEIEAQLVARLEHLHIVPLYDYWRDPDGAYLVMRWLRGGSVKDALAEGPYDLATASLLLDQVAAGLATAHAHHVIHRDLKPSNILLDEEGNAYLADFGIAKDLGAAPTQATKTDVIVGSPDYLSPEQARSQPVSAQTDIYSLGVTLYEVLTGRHPFPELSAVERLFKHINDPLPLITTLDPLVQEEVNTVLQRATAKNPKHRYHDVLEMAVAFRQAAQLGADGRTALLEALTLREQEILQRLIQGQANRDIAEGLVVELSTVKWYLRQIYRKLGVRNRRQAILRARDLDLLISAEDDVASLEGATFVSLSLPAPVNPYKGLRSFETVDAHDYYGRETLVQKLLAALAPSPTTNTASLATVPFSPNRFLAVVGPSGSGKSSVVQAGLIPALTRGNLPGSDRWFIVQMTPGARPLDELEVALIRVAANQTSGLREQLERDENGLLRAVEIALPKDGSELVLVIDQFEELFTLTPDEATRQHFLNMLAATVADSRSRVRVIITLRADYYDRPLHYPRFGELMRSHMETVLPLSAEALEKAISQPALQVGVTCEPGLVATIIDDVLYQPGGLPLLQYALTELFEQRDGRLLTRDAYHKIGGVTGALAKRAEMLYQEQDENGREAIRQMFLRLVALNEKTEALPDTRRRVSRAELVGVTADEDMMDDIIDTFAAYRLLTLDHDPTTRRPTVEVAHEALLREWERLRHWLEASLEDLYQHRRLQMLVQEWHRHEHDPGLLLRETRLDQFAAWVAHSDLALTPDEQAFLEASLLARQDRRLSEENRRQRELETAQRLAETERQRAEEQTTAAQHLRRRAIYLGVALAFAVLLALAAVLAGRQATQNALAAENNAQQAAYQQATAEAESHQRATAEAVAIHEREAAEAQTRLASARELSLAAVNNLAVDPELSVLLAIEAVHKTYTADGFALPEAESALRQGLMSLRLGQVLPSSTADVCNLNLWCSAVAYSGDGTLLAASGAENTAVLFDPTGGEPLLTLDAHDGPVAAIALAPAGQYLATGSADGTAMIWDMALLGQTAVSQQPRLVLAGHTAEITDVAFSPDGLQLATASRDDTIKLWNVVTGQELKSFVGHEGTVRDVLFSHDGTELFSASSDTTVKIWDIASTEVRLTLAGHTDRLTDLALSPDGSRLASAGWDAMVKVWDTATGEELLSFVAIGGRVYAVAFSPDGSLLATGGTDGVVNVWDANTGEPLLALAGHKGLVYNVAFAPTGTHLASGAADGTIRTWDITRAGNREWLTLAGHNWVMFGLDFSPDGTRLASASWDGQVKLWDVATGAELGTLLASESRQMSVEFSPDGQYLATSAINDTAVLWDATTGETLHTFSGHGGPILDVAFTPDGRQLATVGESSPPGLINLWQTITGELATSWVGHEGSIERVAISPDGVWLATASTDGTAKLWQASTGELLATLPDHEAPVNGVNFSHDGRYLATAGADNAARLWALESEGAVVRLMATLQGHTSIVWDVVFSPDDAFVATIGFDGVVKIWEVQTGVERLTLPGVGNNGREVAFSPDGTYLAVTTGEGLVRLYLFRMPDLLALAQSRLKRGLTDSECRQFLHVPQCAR